MRRFAALIILAAGNAAAGTLVQETFLPTGTVRGVVLGLGAGARATGMGEAFVATADDATAGSWNPGGLGQIGSLNAVAIGVVYCGAALPMRVGVAAASVSAVTYGAFDRRDVNGFKSGIENATDIAGTVSWAFPNPGAIPGWCGATVEGLNEANGRFLTALSLGALVPLDKRMTVGATVQHLGPSVQAFGLPGSVKLGGAYQVVDMARIALDLGYAWEGRQRSAGLGVEVKPGNALSLRLGYKLDNVERPGGLNGLTAGLGARFSSFGLDYAYQPFGDLATSHRFALTYAGAPVRPSEGPKAVAPLVARKSASSSATATSPTIAVAGLDAQNVSAGDAAVVSDLLRAEFVRTRAFIVIERQSVERILAEQVFQKTGCTTEECAIKVGRLLNARYVAVGSFGKLLSTYVVSVRVVEVETGAVAFSGVARGENEAELVGPLGELADRMASEIGGAGGGK
jgi:TolB-like protein